MGTGYTRNDTANNIADGNVINASDLDGEFDAIQAAFNGTTGHSHDGTAGEGPQINTAGIADDAVTGAKIDSTTDVEVSDLTATGSATLQHAATTRIATSSTGADITGVLTVDGVSTSADITFGDNDKAIFGAGSDLQIYHDGSHSYIDEQGAGRLYINSGNGVWFGNADASEIQAKINIDGACEFRYDNDIKLATTSTGIDVTGTATMDGLTVDGGSALNGNITINNNTSAISFDSTPLGTNGYKIYANINDSVDGGLSIQDGASNKIALFKSNGDISFYENTGSSPKFFWDASAERLGIGTSSPTTTTLHVQGIAANGSDILHLENDGQTYQRVEFAGTGSVSTARIDASTANGNLILQADPTNVKSGSSMQFEVDGTEAMRIDSSGNVGIGTSSPSELLDMRGSDPAIFIKDGAYTGGLTITQSSTDSAAIIDQAAAQPLILKSSNTGANNYISFVTTGQTNERMRIDASGNVGIGTSSPAAKLDLKHNSASTHLRLTENTSGNWSALGVDSTDNLRVYVNNSERMRINSNGHLFVGQYTTNAPAQSNVDGVVLRENGRVIANTSGTFHAFGRGQDGTIVAFYSEGELEGTISISGTTTSYNGGHLSRWSRLPDGADDSNIYKGTVMTNLNEKIVWEVDAVPAIYWEEGDELPEGVNVGDVKTEAVEAHIEDNEQLNYTNVSSVEGDKNVAGIFVAWDESDEWGDYFLAQTGDLIIRIAAGVTVERGDLLMSAGDGTAKPQADDLVRSSTIAKVISTEVTYTYPDGSYAIPCVVMGC
jgi:hypothetical protein